MKKVVSFQSVSIPKIIIITQALSPVTPCKANADPWGINPPTFYTQDQLKTPRHIPAQKNKKNKEDVVLIRHMRT